MHPGAHNGALIVPILAWTRAFGFVNTLAQIGLPILILTFLFAKSVHRHRTLVNFCITWLIYSVVYSLLIYSGESNETNVDIHKHFIPGPVCIAQSILVHGVTPMVVTSGLIVVLSARHLMWDPQLGGHTKRIQKVFAIASIVAPYLTGTTFIVAAAVVRHRQPHLVTSWHGLFCTFSYGVFHRYVIPGFCLSLSSCLIVLQASMWYDSYTSWRTIGKGFPLADRRVSKTLIFRIAIFTIISIVILMVSIFDLSNNAEGVVPTFLAVCLPLMALIVFGSQKDIFKAWIPPSMISVDAPPDVESQHSLPSLQTITVHSQEPTA